MKSHNVSSPSRSIRCSSVSDAARVVRAARVTDAFTLVELLSVVAIIGILAAVIFPTVATVRRQARTTVELAAAKQLITAYLLSPQDNRGLLMQVSDATKQTHELDVSSPRWSGQMRQYLGDSYKDTLYVNDQVQVYSDLAYDGYRLTLFPSFGLNFQYVGGEPTNTSAVRRLNEAMAPASLIAFASANSRADGENYGYWKITAPTASPSWASADLKDSPESAQQADAYGHVAFRHNGKAIVVYLDGHVGTASSGQLRDMRQWSDQARRLDNPTYRPAVRE